MPYNQFDDNLQVQQLCFQLQSHLRALKRECDDFFLALQQDRAHWSGEQSERYTALHSVMYQLYEEIKIVYEDIEVDKKYQASNQRILVIANNLACDTTSLLKTLRAPIIAETYDRDSDTKSKLQAIKLYQQKHQPESMAIPVLRKVGFAVTAFCAIVAGFVIGALAGSVFGSVVGAWFGYAAVKKMSIFEAPPAEQLKKKAKNAAIQTEQFFKPRQEQNQVAAQDSLECLVFQSK